MQHSSIQVHQTVGQLLAFSLLFNYYVVFLCGVTIHKQNCCHILIQKGKGMQRHHFCDNEKWWPETKYRIAQVYNSLAHIEHILHTVKSIP
jgi:hypothetical protein